MQTELSSSLFVIILPAICRMARYAGPITGDLEQLRISADQDARVGHKSADSAFLGYKTHLAMTEERIITAAIVTTGEKNDGKQLQTLIEKSKSAGIDVRTVVELEFVFFLPYVTGTEGS